MPRLLSNFGHGLITGRKVRSLTASIAVSMIMLLLFMGTTNFFSSIEAAGNKLGVLRKSVGVPTVGVKKEISYVETKIKKGTWGAVPGNDSAAGKAAGLLAVSTVGSGATTTTVWYQIGVDSDGKVFAELGYRSGPLKGSLLQTYSHTVTDNTVFKMTPNGQSVDFHFGSNSESITWDKNSSAWTGSGAPSFNWTDNTEIYWIHEQIEAFWDTNSTIELPGTSSDPFEFGATKYRGTSTGNVKTIPGDQFSPSKWQ